MRQLKIALKILVMIVVISCKKEVVAVDANFLGDWIEYGNNSGNYNEINIRGPLSTFDGYNGTKSELVMGDSKINKRKKELYIGKRKFKINTYPYQENDPTLGTIWKMSLDGVEYYR